MLAIDSEIIYSLNPVSFRWIEDKKEDFGYIAEDLSEISKDLVIYSKEKKPQSVKYSQLSVLIVEEMKKLKERISLLEGRI